MNVIIYSEDFEPITTIDLPLAVIDSAERNGGVALALKSTAEGMPNIIYVTCHKIIWYDKTIKSVLVTKNEELALLLKPDWLVGQKAVIGAYQRTLNILTDKLKKLKPED